MRVGSLCTGYGGLELALHDILGPHEIAFIADVDEAACTVLAARFPDAPNVGDIATATYPDGELDLLTAGYPCQPFSQAGLRSGADDERNLWPYVRDAVRELRPRRVLLENVSGHLRLGFGDVLGDLAELGFDAEWICLPAAGAGAPHLRTRLFCLASDPDRTTRGQWRSSAAGETGSGRARPDPRRSGRAPTPDAGRPRLNGDAQRDGGPQRPGEPTSPGNDADRCPRPELGRYRPAIARWERILGRPAPPHLERGRGGRDVLSVRFVEWMMGLPDGWVTDQLTDVLDRRPTLRLLGNGVVPQQAELAVQTLLARETA